MDGGLRQYHMLVFVIALVAWIGHLADAGWGIACAVLAAVAVPLAVRADALSAALLHESDEPTAFLATLRYYVVRLRQPLGVVAGAAWGTHAHDRYDRWWATALVAAVAYAALVYAARPLDPERPVPPRPSPSPRAALRDLRAGGVDGLIARARRPLVLYVAAAICSSTVDGTDVGDGLAALAGVVLFILFLRAMALTHGRVRGPWPGPAVLVARVVLTAGAAFFTWQGMGGTFGPPWQAAGALTAAATMALVVRPFPAWLGERV